MKQKRKVKSLLPQKNDWRSSFLTAVLLILSVALCIGSASLITSRVRAVEPGEIGVFDYNGLDEKQEVIYGMRFVDPAYMRTEVNNMYIKGKSFYITPNSVIVNPMTVGGDNIDTNINKVNPGVYGHVLGGKDNVVNSDNVTLIAGENNVVTEGNANAAFLGGQSNNNFGRMREGGTPMVVVGGSNNSIGDNHDGVALIGGNGNKIWDNVSDSFILGGEDNEIGTDRTNVIVGGKKVKVRNVDNVFVYSNKGDGTNPNGEFEPQSSDSFYLNVGNGVGINTNPSNRGLAVGGVVNLGEIDIRTLECNEDNLGVEGKVSNCVVGCTKASLPRGQWEMLDRGVECQAVCGGIPGNRCIFTGEVIEPAPSYDSYCTPADFTGHSHMCYEDELEEYGNSVFETSLIDSDKECPASDENENKCVYQCDDGYHLTGNVTGGKPGTYRCYKDCEYQWENGEKVIYKHNETVIGYNVNIVACSNNVYMFPYDTEIIPAGTRTREGLSALIPAGISIGNKVINGRTYNNRATNGYSPETCGNYDHKKTLVCNNGTMYLTKNDGKKATNMKARDYGYKYKECDTANYRCDLNEYHLTKTDITKSFTDEGLQDSGNGWNNKKDREQFSLTRGQYKLCLDYNGVSPESCEQVDKLDATKLAHDEHYKFIKCNTPYYTEYPAGSEHCMKSCSVTLNGGNEPNVPHGQTRDFYKSNEKTCLDRCEWATFTCDDGKWIQSGTNQVRDETSPYQYYGCTQKDKLCDRAVYNVSQKEHDDHISTSLYEESCDEYDGKQRNICDFTLTVYRLTGCKPGYHTENGKWCVDNVKDMACPSKPSNSHWVRTSGPIQNYPWSNIITKYKTTLNAGWYLVWWNESCAWNDPISCWTDELQPGNGGKVSPGNACEWACDTGYIRNGNTCRYIETTCKYPDGDQSACTNDEPYGCEDVDARTQKEGQGAGEGEWRWECTNDKTSEACLICKDGYHLEKDASGNRKCKPNVNGMCDPNPSGNYGCLAGLIDERSDLDESKYTWWCRGIDGYDRSHDEGPYCSSATDVDNCYKCKPGYHKTSNYGECLINECSSTNRPSGDGVIYGEGTPDTHNKSWSYVSSSYLGACQWTCDESEGYERYGNGCRLKTYTITYNGNGGTPERSSDSVTHGDYVDLPGATRDCHSFDYWMEGSSRQWSPYGPVYADATLTAHWTEDEFTVEYRNNGHGIAPASQTMKYSTETKVRNGITANDGYKFVNWCTAGGTCYNPGDVINAADTCPTQDLVLYAQWIENTALLTYNANGFGTAPDPVNLYYGTKATAADAIPGDINHAFIEWCKQGGTCYDPGDTVKDANVEPEDITLYAQWVKCQGSFENARQIKGIGTSTSNLTSTLWDTESEANSHSCSWVCKSGFKPNAAGTRCEVINYSCGRSLETVNKCFDGSNYVAGTSTSHSQNEYNRYCGDLECGLCDENSHISGQRPDPLHAGLCKNSSSISLCRNITYEDRGGGQPLVLKSIEFELQGGTLLQDVQIKQPLKYYTDRSAGGVYGSQTYNPTFTIKSGKTKSEEDKPYIFGNRPSYWANGYYSDYWSFQDISDITILTQVVDDVDFLGTCSAVKVETPQPNNNCSATTKGGYDISAMSNNQTKTVYRDITYGQCKATAKCTDGSVSIEDESCCADSISYLSNSIKITACRGRYNQSAADSITIADKNVGASTRSLTSYGTKYKWIDDIRIREYNGQLFGTCYVGKEYGRVMSASYTSVSACPGTFMLDVPAAENIKDRCGAGYKVPTYMDWDNLVELFNDLHVDLLSNIAGSTPEEKFSNALYLPRGGASLVEVGHAGMSSDEIVMCYEPWYTDGWRANRGYFRNVTAGSFYWSSSVNGENYLYDGVWYFDADKMDSIDAADYRNEFYVRCFKS